MPSAHPAPCTPHPVPPLLTGCRYGILVLAVEVLGGLAMLPYGLCLTMRVTNNQVPPPDDKGQVGDWVPACLLAVMFSAAFMQDQALSARSKAPTHWACLTAPPACLPAPPLPRPPAGAHLA